MISGHLHEKASPSAEHPDREVLTVQRWHEDGYLVVQTAGRGETVRAEPFDAVDLRVGVLFGDEPDE